ncbi:autotransporter domain-containing protein [uncultured Sutterella sp.]|uniref:autotransporter domain-containing protein n=1 Tax=uncultured Sutterella sp. TaxID=286133 RepID=UPI00262D47B9|nr:autotransporter domain-containing protein [uncultured Sutterella sp.]
MNKTFKVARSLTRGTVVTSEKASSYQGKAVKTVVAAAVSALMLSAGAVMAADAETTTDPYTITKDTTFKSGDLTEAAVKNLTLESGTLTVNGFNQVQNLVVNGGKLVITGSSDVKTWDGNGFGAFAETKDADGQWVATKANATVVKNAEVVVTNANFFAGKATEDTKGTKFTFDNAKITLAGKTNATAGMIFAAGSTLSLINGTTLTVADKNYGVLNLGTEVKEGERKTATISNSIVDVAGELAVGTYKKKTDTSVAFGDTTRGSTTQLNFDASKLNVAATGKFSSDNVTLKNGSTVTNAGTVGGDLYVVDGSSITNAAGAKLDVDGLEISNGGSVVNNGTLTVKDITIGKGGVLETITAKVVADAAKKVEAAEFTATNVTVNAGGTFKLLDYNSTYAKGTTHAPEGTQTSTKDQYHGTNGQTLTLNGGSFVTATGNVDRVKVGSQTESGTFAINNGAYTLKSLVVGKEGTVRVGTYGELTVDTLDLSGSTNAGDTPSNANMTNSGKLTVGTVATDVVASKFTNKGKLYTSYENLFKKGADGEYTEATSFGTALNDEADTGTTYETAYAGNITAKQWKDAQAKVGNIVFDSATLVGADNKGNAELKDVDSLNVKTATVDLTATTAAAEGKVANKTTIGSVVVKQTGSTAVTSVTLAGTDATANPLVIRGTNGEFLTFDKSVDASKVKTIKLDAVTLGEEATDGARLEKIVTIGTTAGLKVAAGDWTLTDVAGEGNVTVSGGGLTLLGTTTENKVGNKTYTALDFGNVKDNTYTGNLTVDAGSYLALGDYAAEAASALASIQSDLAADEPKASVIYIGQQILSSAKANFALPTTRANTHNNFVVIDLENVASTAGYDKTQGIYNNDTPIAYATVKAQGVNANVLTIGENGVGSLNLGTGLKNLDVDFGNVFYTNATADADGFVDVLVNDSEVSDMVYAGFHTRELVKNAVETYTAPKGNVIANTIYTNWGAFEAAAEQKALDATIAAGLVKEGTNALWASDGKVDTSVLEAGVKVVDVENLFEDSYDAAIADVVAAEHAATNMAVAGGAFTAALDYNDQVTAALDRRTSLVNAERVQGFTPWVDVFGTTNEAKRLYGNGQGYETDIYGAVLGFDYTAVCGGVFGVAFNVGTGDGNSVGSGYKVDNDADYYGFSAYGAYSTGMFNVKADIGYTQASNDLSTSSAYFGSVKESLDADIFTVGVGTEVLVKAGAFNVVPHAGIRLNRLSMDDSKYGADYDDMTVYQLPLGVAVSSTFETNGWKVAPMADVSVVPTFGDKDAVASYYGGVTETTRVVDTNPVQGTLGVEAQNGAFTFGLNYRLTAGGDDRLNNSFNANVRYAF